MSGDHKEPKEYFLNKLEEQAEELEEEILELEVKLAGDTLDEILLE